MTQEAPLLPQPSNLQRNTFQSQKYFITPQPNLTSWWNLSAQHIPNPFSRFCLHSQQGLQTHVHPCNNYSKCKRGVKSPSCRVRFLLAISPLMLPYACWIIEDVLSGWILEIDLTPPFSGLSSGVSILKICGRFAQVKCEQGFQDVDLWATDSLKKAPKHGKKTCPVYTIMLTGSCVTRTSQSSWYRGTQWCSSDNNNRDGEHSICGRAPAGCHCQDINLPKESS